MNKSIEQYTSEINEVIATMRKSSVNLFELLRDARKNLNTEDYDKLLKGIDMERTTLSKLNKIFGCNVVMNNIEMLPAGWGTLYEMAMLDDDLIIGKMQNNVFNKKTTKKEVQEVRRNAAFKHDDKSAIVITLTLTVKDNVEKTELKSDIEQATSVLTPHFEVKSNVDKFFKDAA